MHALPRAQPSSRPRALHQILLVRLRPSRHAPPRARPANRARPGRHLPRPRLPHRRQPPHRPSPAHTRAIFLGLYSRHQHIDTIDLAELIGIVFHPGGTLPFFPDNTHLFTNCETSLEDSLGQRRSQPPRRSPRSSLRPRKIRISSKPSLLRHRLGESKHPRRVTNHRLRPDPPPPRPRHHHHRRTHPQHRPQPSSPLPALPRTDRRLTQALLPHPALPAVVQQMHRGARHPLGRTSPRLRLLRPVPLRQRLPRLLRPESHRLLRHSTPLEQPHHPRLKSVHLRSARELHAAKRIYYSGLRLGRQTEPEERYIG